MKVIGFHPEGVIEPLEAYCVAFGHELLGVKDNLQDALESNAEAILISELTHLGSTREILEIAQIKHLILRGVLDTSNPVGTAVITILAAIFEWEREMNREQLKRGRKAKAEAGGYAYGSPKFGTKTVGGELVVDEREAEALDLIRRHRKSGKSYQAIANYLNAKGIPAKRGGEWSAKTVQRVIK
jgi:site-specific DNA recombinase